MASLTKDLTDTKDLIGMIGVGKIVHKILEIVKDETADDNIIDQLAILTKKHSEHLRLGKVFGFSVGDYAFASLKWINTEYSLSIFDRLFQLLSDSRKESVNELIDSKAYLKI